MKRKPIVIDEEVPNDYLEEQIMVLRKSNPDYPYHALKKSTLLPILEELLSRRLNPDYDMENI